jgi:hypothetical protein
MSKNMHNAEDQPVLPFTSDADSDALPERRSLVTVTIFGAFVGLLMGAAVGAACCWLTGLYDFLRPAVVIGSLAGPFLGAVTGVFLERRVPNGLPRPDLATVICLVFSVLPALLVLLQGIGFLGGGATPLRLAGAVCAGPMAAWMIGALLDRAFDAKQKKSWGEALGSAVVAVAACIAIVWLFDANAYGPDPDELAWQAKNMLEDNWRKHPVLRDATVLKVTLVRHGRWTYTGHAEVTRAGQTERVPLEARVDGKMLEVRVTGEP